VSIIPDLGKADAELLRALLHDYNGQITKDNLDRTLRAAIMGLDFPDPVSPGGDWYLHSGGLGSTPDWLLVDSLRNKIITGAGSPLTFNPGTGALSLTIARGGLITAITGFNVPAVLAIGANGTVLKSDGLDPSWGQVGSTNIATDAVGSAQIAADAVGTSEIATDAVTAAEIAANAVGTTEIANDAVTAAKIANDAVGSSEIAADAVTASEIAAGAVGDSELASPDFDVYRRLEVASCGIHDLLTGMTAWFQGGGLASSGTGQPQTEFNAIPLLHIDSVDFDVPSKTTKLRLTAHYYANATAPAITMTAGLYPISSMGGGADLVAITLGTVVSGSTAAITTPSASAMTTQDSGDFDLPTDGHYVLGCVLSGAPAANSKGILKVKLDMHHV